MVRPIDVSWLPPRIDMHRYTTGISGISIVVATMRRPEKLQNFAPGGEEGVDEANKEAAKAKSATGMYLLPASCGHLA